MHTSLAVSLAFDNLPKINPAGLVPERHLQANSFRRVDHLLRPGKQIRTVQMRVQRPIAMKIKVWIGP
jgi:hypothetical protein